MSPWFGKRHDATRFLILFPGRTGSSWLVDGLSRHPAICVEGEVLVGRSAAAQEKIYKRILGAGSGPRASGFKTKLKDVADPESLRRCVRENNVVVISMQRADLLRLALSRINARRLYEATGAWNVRDGAKPMGDGEVSAEELAKALSDCRSDVRSLEEFVGSLGVEPHVIEYADIIDSPESVLAKAQNWIGVEAMSLLSSVVKNTNENLAHAVSNFAELRDEMSGGTWGPVFDVDPFKEGCSSRER